MKLLVKLPDLILFIAFYLKELVLASLRVAYDVLRPSYHIRPAILAVPLDAKTDIEILLLTNLINMTPGSLSIDISSDRRVLYVHAMYVDDPDTLREEIKSSLERRIISLLR